MLRVSREAEERGIDWLVHGERAYPPSAYVDGWPDADGDVASEACAPPAEANSLANLLPTGVVVVQFEGTETHAGVALGGDNGEQSAGVYRQKAFEPVFKAWT